MSKANIIQEYDWQYNSAEYHVKIFSGNHFPRAFGWKDDNNIFLSNTLPNKYRPYLLIYLFHSRFGFAGKPNRIRLALIEELNHVPSSLLSEYITFRRDILAETINHARIKKQKLHDIDEILEQLKLLDEIEK